MLSRFSTPPASPHDPFARWPGMRSRIAGLRDGEPTGEADLVFHTAYTSFDPGPLLLQLRFAGLTATRGRMQLVIKSLGDEDGAERVQGTTLVELPRLAADGGGYRLSVMIRPRHAYAFAARILDDDTDAQADGLTLYTSQTAAGPTFARKLSAARVTVARAPRSADGLVAETPATLANLHSQMCTAAQFDEPDYDRWIAAMHRAKHRHRKQWEYVWICRALEVMGALRDGARGLGFGCGIEPLPALFAAHGIFVTATDLGAQDRRAQRWQDTDQHLLSAQALNDAAICPPDRFFAQVQVAAVDMNKVPDDLVDYDFCWSSCSLEHLGSIGAGLAFVERSLATLKPGGVAVHTTELNLTSNTRTIGKGGTVLFRRSDIEGFARRLTAAGHKVLPITFDQGDQPEDQVVDVAPFAADIHFKLALKSYVTTSFGLAIRKGG